MEGFIEEKTGNRPKGVCLAESPVEALVIFIVSDTVTILYLTKFLRKLTCRTVVEIRTG